MKRKPFLLIGVFLLLISCNFPFVENTPPVSSAPTIQGQTPTVVETFDLSKRKQKNIFEDLWETVDEEYLYEDFNGVDWDAVYDTYEAAPRARRLWPRNCCERCATRA